MLKLPKGLKKKKKGKKSKKDQELFTEEELEQYKLQQQQKQLQQQQQQQQQHDEPQEFDQPAEAPASDTEVAKGSSTSDPKGFEDDDEWLKFKQLTAGVDSILHKTQDDLDRIKSTSFFKRVPPPSEQLRKDKEEAARREAERLEAERRKKEEEEANRDVLAEAVVELSESEEESEEADDIFDTGYIEAITSGEVQFAIVPDSPEYPIDDGPDPFDTSYADKLIKGPEVSKRGKKLVNIGSAVEVLTGRVESAQPAGSLKRKPRKGPQDLLLDGFEEDTSASPAPETDVSATPEPPKTLLDELEDDIPGELPPIDLSVSLHLNFQKQAEDKLAAADAEKLDVVSEFDTLRDDEDDEFAELAAESLNKKEEAVVVVQPLPLEFTGKVEGNWAEFDAQPDPLSSEAYSKVKPPRPPAVFSPSNPAPIGSDDEFALPEDDPFDTTFVEKVITAKEEDDDFDFDPRAEERKQDPELTIERDLFAESDANVPAIPSSQGRDLTVTHKDLLGGSNTDLSALGPLPINPLSGEAEREEREFDPFDTSAVSNLVQPKEVELKFLEKELLEEPRLKRVISDPDFDPRAEEDAAQVDNSANLQSEQLDQAQRKSSLHLNFQQKAVGFLVPDQDLLDVSHDSGKIHKPLTPYYSKEPAIIDTDLKEQEDPFDTSFVPDSKPTQVELNLLEQDLVASANLKHSLSDPDFDPRAEDFSVEVSELKPKSDLLVVESQIDIKVLTPATEINNREFESEEIKYVDPFDTSSVESNILPGQTELKLIESELLTAKLPEPAVGVLDTLTDAEELGIGSKVLTPQGPVATTSISAEDVDPFDTSFAENLGPGNAEIRVLETELINN